MRRLGYIFSLISVTIILGFCGKTSGFPPTDSLKPLKLSLVADFSELEDVGLVGDVELMGNDEIVFTDVQRNTIYRTNISSRKLTPIGRSGEGPGEYSSVSDLYVDGDRLYIVEGRSKIMVYSIDGKFISEQKLKGNFFRAWFVGKIGEEFILAKMVMKNRIEPYLGVYRWKEGKEPELIVENPVSQKTKKRESAGRIAFQIFFISFPAYGVIEDKIFSSASHTYTFSFLDINGKIIKKVTIDAPEPQIHPSFRKGRKIKRDRIYAVIHAYMCRENLCLISSYYRDNFPRLDVFSKEGKYLRSYFIPLPFDRPIASTIKIQKGYLIFYSIENSGFKIYRLPEKI